MAITLRSPYVLVSAIFGAVGIAALVLLVPLLAFRFYAEFWSPAAATAAGLAFLGFSLNGVQAVVVTVPLAVAVITIYRYLLTEGRDQAADALFWATMIACLLVGTGRLLLRRSRLTGGVRG